MAALAGALVSAVQAAWLGPAPALVVQFAAAAAALVKSGAALVLLVVAAWLLLALVLGPWARRGSLAELVAQVASIVRAVLARGKMSVAAAVLPTPCAGWTGEGTTVLLVEQLGLPAPEERSALGLRSAISICRCGLAPASRNAQR